MQNDKKKPHYSCVIQLTKVNIMVIHGPNNKKKMELELELKLWNLVFFSSFLNSNGWN